jgi:starch-binding outer membrane protein, SusD/RagB family
MKKSIYLIYALILISLYSCKVRDVEPVFQVPDEVAITDKVSAEAAVNGAYNALGRNEYYGVNYRAFAILSASDVVKWVGNSNNFRQFNNHNLFADNSSINDTWNAIYRTINITNNILEKVPALNVSGLSDADKNKLTGEAYFIRALCYFDLARAWGGVPIILTATHSADATKGIRRSNQSQVYDRVQLDLDQAIALLPASPVNRNRAVKNTAVALRARLHLYRQEWQAAVADASTVISSPDYSLVTPYSNFYLTKNTPESVFELFYTINNKNNYATNWLPGSLGGRREWVPISAFVTQVRDSSTGGNRKAYILEKTPAESGQTLYGNMNFKISTGDDDAFIIRIAELYLIRAEALARLGGPDGNASAQAVSDLNLIRNRAQVKVPPISDITNEQLIEAVLKERKYEFAFEGQWWFDLVRTDKAATVLNISDRNKYLFPIPQNQILIDPDLTQNPSY